MFFGGKSCLMISIIIRTYNEEKYLRTTLDHIYAQKTNHTFEVIIVDSGSTDATLEIASQYALKVVHINKEVFSFGKSLNIGCAEATGDIFVFISAHCIPVNESWLRLLVSPFDSENIALTYSRQIGHKVTKLSEHQVFSKYFPQKEKNEQGGYFCNNASSAVRKSFWHQYRFNEELTGLEDLDWAKHFFKKGYLIKYVPESVVFHVHEESWKRIKIRYEREAFALKEIMPEVCFSFMDMAIAIFRGVAIDARFALKTGKIGKLFEIIAFRCCQFYGAYRGGHAHRAFSKRKKQSYFYP